MKLEGKITATRRGAPILARLATTLSTDPRDRSREMLLVGADREMPSELEVAGSLGAFTAGRPESEIAFSAVADRHLAVSASREFCYLSAGDVIRIDPGLGRMRVLYRRSSPHNSLLVTERCNSSCLMCSQPPRDVDDRHLIDEIIEAIPLMASDTIALGITGGEPTLHFEGLLKVIAAVRDHLPRTALHLLSNGRLFAYPANAKEVADVRHQDLMIGIPVYSDLAKRHDFVVQAAGAFDQTMRGLMNLARYGVPVEIRVVIHRRTVARLPELGAFISRHIPFANHVALMGLELTGYARTNLEALWIDPNQYQDQLRACVDNLLAGGVSPRIYNHQLCVLDRALWSHAVASISDWKNVYVEECAGCAVRGKCGGFFASAVLRRSSGIRAIP